MLAPLMTLYIVCMPMGYMIGKMYMWSRANRYDTELEQKKALDNFAFVPYLAALLLPIGAILSIQMILQGDEY